MSSRIIENVNIKCEKCGKEIGFKVYYQCDKNIDSKIYKKTNLDDVEVCSCKGACNQYINKYNALPMSIVR